MEKHPKPPNNLVVILETDTHDIASIRRTIEEGDYRTAVCATLRELKSTIAEPCLAAILDLDSVPLDNRSIRALALFHPATRFLCTSRKRFHPDLQDAIRDHLFACLHKPVDPDELHYFLRCIRSELTGSRASPDGAG